MAKRISESSCPLWISTRCPVRATTAIACPTSCTRVSRRMPTMRTAMNSTRGAGGCTRIVSAAGARSLTRTMPRMETRQLGRTGVEVTPLCLGAMMFGAWGNEDHDESIRIIHRALDAGINFVDTADVYSRGESEEIVGKALAGGRRDRVVLATKVHGTMGDDPNQFGNSKRWIRMEVENSLRRLRTDWIDLYQIHRPEEDTHLDETLGALTDLV